MPACRSFDVAVLCLVRDVLGDAERETGAVPQHVPATVASTNVNGTVTDETPNLCVSVIGAVVEVGTHRTVGLVEPLEEQLQGDPASSCHLPANSWAGELTQRPGSSAFQNSTSASCLSRGESMQTCTILDRWPSGQVTGSVAVWGFSEMTQKGRPPGDDRIHHRSALCGAQRDGLRNGLLGIVGLQVHMHSRRAIDLLEVDVGVAVGWLEAAQLGVVRPWISHRPAEGPGPEVGRRAMEVGWSVHDGVQPSHRTRGLSRPSRARPSRGAWRP